MATSQHTREATGVYCITNTVNGKVYVGSAAVSLRKRLIQHRVDLKRKKHKNKHLQAAWNKYGADAFKFETLETCSPQECLTREQWWIDHLNATDRRLGYNKSPTAGSPLGIKRAPISPEHRARLSQWNRERWQSEGNRERMAERMRELWQSEEHRQRVAEGQQATLEQGESRAKMSEVMLGRWQSEEERPRLLRAIRERAQTPEAQAKRNARVQEIRDTPEYRAKQGEDSRERWKDEAFRERQSEAIRAALSDPEVRAKMSAAMKRRKLTPEHRANIAAGLKRRREALAAAKAAADAAPQT